ncbi:MAG: CHAT domain-containing protein, partial [Bacteroidota bacterium]
EIPTLRQQPKQAEALAEANRELYQLLLGDLYSFFPSRIHIVANGFLEPVSFSSLRMDTEGPARYLGVEHAVSRQFSIKTMQMLQETEMDPDRIGVLGFAPAFENELVDASELRQAGFILPPLTYNQEELRNLAEKSSGKFYYGDEATLDRYQDKAPKYSMLHLATHAISSEVEGLNSRVYLLDDAAEPVSLRAADVSLQPLRAELVTLSACETGGGGLNIVEGRVGLTKAFIAAGARSVVASNWAVDDHATAELMDYFYTATKEGKSPDLALQHARKTYLEVHPGAPPALWAAFEAFGGLVAPQWQEKIDWWKDPMNYLVAVVILLIAGVSLKRLRYA